MKKRGSWIRECEHYVLRVLSVVFSAVSAHAILWFYSSMDKVVDTSDPLQPYVKWGLAIGFTALGYFISRGLVHRMLNKEPIKVYMAICLFLELVEFSANFSQAAVSIHSVDWLHLFSGPLFLVLQAMVFLVMPITPLFTLALAVVDMDLDRAKQGYVVQGFGMARGGSTASAPSLLNGMAKAVSPRASQPPVAYPKQAPMYPTQGPMSGHPTAVPVPAATYPVPPAAGSGQSQGNLFSNLWGNRRGAASPPPVAQAAVMPGASPANIP